MSTSRAPSDDSGFTLVELVMSIAILTIIMAAITGSLIAFLKNGTYASERDDHSGGAVLLSSYLNRDLASGDTITVPGTTCASTPSGTNALTLSWSEWSATPADPTPVAGSIWRASYVVLPDITAVGGGARYKLQRVLCRPDGTTDRALLLRNLTGATGPADAVNAQAGSSTTACPAPSRQVKVQLPTYAQDLAAQGYSFSGCLKGRTR